MVFNLITKVVASPLLLVVWHDHHTVVLLEGVNAFRLVLIEIAATMSS